jgi:hypothetical protein
MQRNDSPSQPVERRQSLSYAEFVADYCLPRRPVILTDAISEWPATARWTPDYFVERAGDTKVEIDGSTYSVDRLVELIADSTPEDPAPYLRAQKVVDVFPGLAADLEPPIKYSQPNWADSALLLPPMRRGRLHEILIGGRGAGFHVLHYDKDHLHAFISQFYGDKEFFVYAPDQTPRLYPKPSTPNQSPVDIFDPDLERHPDFAHAEQITLTLHPGETVFMPAGWWHTTRMTGPSISVTWNTVNATNWSDVAADTRQRVLRKGGAPAAAAFDLYTAVVARARRGRDRRPVSAPVA